MLGFFLLLLIFFMMMIIIIINKKKKKNDDDGCEERILALNPHFLIYYCFCCHLLTILG